MNVKGKLHDPVGFTPRETAPGIYCIGSWVDLRAGCDGEEKHFLPLPGTELRLRSLVAIPTDVLCRMSVWTVSILRVLLSES
jgi:hypothetical protein